MAWDAKAIVVNDRKFKGRGHRATGDEFAAAPNIDHMQEYVRSDLTDWLKWLRAEMGFDGWRYTSPTDMQMMTLACTKGIASELHVLINLFKQLS